MRMIAPAVVLLSLSGAAVAAHELHAQDPRVFSAWDRATLVGLCAVAALYWTGAARLRIRGGRQSSLEHASFAAGWFALVAAVLPWVDAAAIESFSAHMAQHELMMLVAAPLLIAGRPLSTCLWALPERRRRGAGASPGARAATRVMRAASSPMLAWALHGAVLWIWHVPVLYDLAVRSEPAHAVQHAMFVGTSAMFWTGLLYGRYGRAGYGAGVFFVFTTAVHTGILGALFTLAATPLYSSYAGGPEATAAALADQQLAGLVMWIPAGLLLTLVGIALFAAWLGEAERRGDHADRAGRGLGGSRG